MTHNVCGVENKSEARETFFKQNELNIESVSFRYEWWPLRNMLLHQNGPFNLSSDDQSTLIMLEIKSVLF